MPRQILSLFNIQPARLECLQKKLRETKIRERMKESSALRIQSLFRGNEARIKVAAMRAAKQQKTESELKKKESTALRYEVNQTKLPRP